MIGKKPLESVSTRGGEFYKKSRPGEMASRAAGDWRHSLESMLTRYLRYRALDHHRGNEQDRHDFTMYPLKIPQDFLMKFLVGRVARDS